LESFVCQGFSSNSIHFRDRNFNVFQK